MLDPLELRCLTPVRRIAAPGVRVTADGKKKARPFRKQAARDPVKRREADRRYRANNLERVRAVARAAGKRRYWRNVEKLRAEARVRMTGKQLKESYTPEAWARRQAMLAATRAKLDADPKHRAMRLAKARAYWHRKQAERKARG